MMQQFMRRVLEQVVRRVFLTFYSGIGWDAVARGKARYLKNNE